MKYVKLCAAAALLLCSCSNLFFHDVPGVVPAPRVESTVPSADKNEVPLNTSIAIYFTIGMDTTTISDETVVVQKVEVLDGGIERYENVPGGLTYTDNNEKGAVTFTLPEAGSFLMQTRYLVMVKSRVKDLRGKKMEDDYFWYFTTGGVMDNEPPALEGLNPIMPEYLANTDNRYQSFDVYILFNEPLDPASARNLIFEFRYYDEIYGSYRPLKSIYNVISNNNIIYKDPLSNALVVRLLNIKLVPPGEYEIELIGNASDIKDLSGNSFAGLIKKDIHHLVTYKIPCDIPDQEGACCP